MVTTCPRCATGAGWDARDRRLKKISKVLAIELEENLNTDEAARRMAADGRNELRAVSPPAWWFEGRGEEGRGRLAAIAIDPSAASVELENKSQKWLLRLLDKR